MPVISTIPQRPALGLACLLSLAVAMPVAADYRAQLDLVYDDRKLATGEKGGDPGQDIFTGVGRYYFEDIVEDGSLPRSTLAFTQRASSASIGFRDVDGFTNGSGTEFAARAVLAGAVIAEFAYEGGEDDVADRWSVGAGMYFAGNQAVVISYSDISAVDDEDDREEFSARYNGVHEASEGHTELGLEVAYSDDIDNEFTWLGEVNYYPVRNLGFGFSVGEVLSDLEGETDILGLHLEMFPTAAFAFSLAYEFQGLDNDEDFEDITTVSLGVTGRL